MVVCHAALAGILILHSCVPLQSAAPPRKAHLIRFEDEVAPFAGPDPADRSAVFPDAAGTTLSREPIDAAKPADYHSESFSAGSTGRISAGSTGRISAGSWPKSSLAEEQHLAKSRRAVADASSEDDGGGTNSSSAATEGAGARRSRRQTTDAEMKEMVDSARRIRRAKWAKLTLYLTLPFAFPLFWIVFPQGLGITSKIKSLFAGNSKPPAPDEIAKAGVDGAEAGAAAGGEAAGAGESSSWFW